MSGKKHSFDEYMETFCPNTCPKCKGEGRLIRSRHLIYCDACDGTGRKNKRTDKELVAEALSRVRPFRRLGSEHVERLGSVPSSNLNDF